MKFNIQSLTPLQKKLRQRILEVSHQQHLSHLGSCFSSVDIIAAVYEIKKTGDEFILSNGHAGMAWYVVLEDYGFISAKQLKKLLVHPDRQPKLGITVSSGSLGQGLPIAVGMAVADRTKTIFCMISDGELAEGSIWEALRVAGELGLSNLKIIVNANGWAAYRSLNLQTIRRQLKGFVSHITTLRGHDFSQLVSGLQQQPSAGGPQLFLVRSNSEQLPFLRGQDAHYHTMTESEYQSALALLA
jgi:transketolase